MFGLRFKSAYRNCEYSRFSEEDQAVRRVYERQYDPFLDIGGFGFLGFILYSLAELIFGFEYSFDYHLFVFLMFMFVRLWKITEEEGDE